MQTCKHIWIVWMLAWSLLVFWCYLMILAVQTDSDIRQHSANYIFSLLHFFSSWLSHCWRLERFSCVSDLQVEFSTMLKKRQKNRTLPFRTHFANIREIKSKHSQFIAHFRILMLNVKENLKWCFRVKNWLKVLSLLFKQGKRCNLFTRLQSFLNAMTNDKILF